MWTSAAVVVLAAAVAVGVKWPNTAPSHESPLSRERAFVYREPKSVKLARDDGDRALAAAARFLQTAVRRERVGSSWDVTTANLRQGATRAQWRTEDIPVVPYPLKFAQWRLEYSYKDRLGLRVLLFPRRNARIAPASFDMELRAVGRGKNRRWLVDYWVPRGTAPQARRTRAPGFSLAPDFRVAAKPQLSATWLLVPVALFSLLLLVPLTLVLRGYVRTRRARGSYTSDHGLADLSRYRSDAAP